MIAEISMLYCCGGGHLTRMVLPGPCIARVEREEEFTYGRFTVSQHCNKPTALMINIPAVYAAWLLGGTDAALAALVVHIGGSSTGS